MAPVAGIYGCFVLLLTYIVMPSAAAGRAVLARIFSTRWKIILVFAYLLLPYVVYALGTRDFRWVAVARLLGIAAPPIILYFAIAVAPLGRLAWQDGFAAVWFVCAVLFHLLNGIWRVPVNLDFMGRLFVAGLGALCWIYIRPVPDLGYQFDLRLQVVSAAIKNFVFFAAIAIPLGFFLGFTAWNLRWRGWLDFGLASRNFPVYRPS